MVVDYSSGRLWTFIRLLMKILFYHGCKYDLVLLGNIERSSSGLIVKLLLCFGA